MLILNDEQKDRLRRHLTVALANWAADCELEWEDLDLLLLTIAEYHGRVRIKLFLDSRDGEEEK